MALCDKLNSSVADPSSHIHMVAKGEVVVDDIPSEKLQKRQSPDRENHALQSDKEGGTLAILPQNASHEPDTRTLVLHSHQQGILSSAIPEKRSPIPGTGFKALQSGQEGTIPRGMEKALQTLDSGLPVLQSGQEGSAPSITREKGPDDGYNWRKYGQKNVKGNEYIRSYYKCTQPNCLVKRQVERTHDGQITDTIYFGQHDHPQPQLSPPLAAGLVVSIVKDKLVEHSATSVADKLSPVLGQVPHQIKPDATPLSSVAVRNDVKRVLSASSRIREEVDDADQDSKRQKKHDSNVDVPSVDKPTGKPRLVVQTVSEVDIVNDGYRWRKYGQKLVKGNPNPRSYYRCSNPGCPMKKHVERAFHDSKVVVTTYEGQHDHGMPALRTVTHNAGGQNISMTAQNDESCSKSGETDAFCTDKVINTNSGPDTNSNEQLKANSRTKSDIRQMLGFDKIVIQSNLDPESKTSEQHNSESATQSDKNDSHGEVVHSSCGTDSRPTEQLNGELRPISGMVHVTSGMVGVPNEQQTRNAEPVKS